MLWRVGVRSAQPGEKEVRVSADLRSLCRQNAKIKSWTYPDVQGRLGNLRGPILENSVAAKIFL